MSAESSRTLADIDTLRALLLDGRVQAAIVYLEGMRAQRGADSPVTATVARPGLRVISGGRSAES